MRVGFSLLSSPPTLSPITGVGEKVGEDSYGGSAETRELLTCLSGRQSGVRARSFAAFAASHQIFLSIAHSNATSGPACYSSVKNGVVTVVQVFDLGVTFSWTSPATILPFVQFMFQVIYYIKLTNLLSLIRQSNSNYFQFVSMFVNFE